MAWTIALAVLAVTCGLVLSEEPPKCCYPEQLEGISFSLSDERTIHLFAADYNKGLMLTYSGRRKAENGELKHWFVLLDLTQGKSYRYSGNGRCSFKVGFSQELLSRCVPKNATWAGTFNLGGADTLVDFWHSETKDKRSYMLRGVDKSCLPVIISAYAPTWNEQLRQVYFNTRKGVLDQTIFDRAKAIIKDSNCQETSKNVFKK